jgi:hypothetical protein
MSLNRRALGQVRIQGAVPKAFIANGMSLNRRALGQVRIQGAVPKAKV